MREEGRSRGSRTPDEKSIALANYAGRANLVESEHGGVAMICWKPDLGTKLNKSGHFADQYSILNFIIESEKFTFIIIHQMFQQI